MRRNVLESMDPRELGARLAEARKARELTQEEAAARIGVARTTLTAVEKGQRRVQARELAQLAELYGRPVGEIIQQEPLAQFAPRLRAGAGVDATDPRLAPAIAEFRDLCQDYVRLEDLCQAPLQYRYPELFVAQGLPPAESAQELASLERNRLGLGDGPVADLRRVLEGDVGLRVFVMPLPSDVSGMYEYDQRAGGCIALNANHPPERRRWSAAHDHAHFLAHRYEPEVTPLHPGRRVPDEERFADAFAACFLMPAAGVRRHFYAQTRGEVPTVGDLLLLADRYGVSAEAMALRLEGLGLRKDGAWARAQAAGVRVREAQAVLGLSPAHDHDDYPPYHSRVALPLRYRYLAVLAYEEERISEGQLARILRTDAVDARATIEAIRARGPLQVGDELPAVELSLSVRLVA